MPQMPRRPNFAATMMGVVPYRDMDHAAEIITACCPEAPCLPAMTRSIRWMLEGIPCLVFDRKRRRVYFDLSTEREAELLEFYDRWEADDLDYFAATRENAPFIHEMIARFRDRRPPQLKWIIFHTAGPLLFGDFIKQADGTPSIHNETLRDVLIKGMNIKARWIGEKIKAEIPGVDVIADLPETTLVTFTSAAGTGSRDQIIQAIDQSFEKMDWVTWVHCCANIDWSLLTDSAVHVINFDAYQHAEAVALYATQLKGFLARGGMLAWGIVPVDSGQLKTQTAQRLLQRLQNDIRRLASHGIDEQDLAGASWVMPCCDTVLLSPAEADRALHITAEISTAMKQAYGFAVP